jgi:hypothetical protein
MLALVQFTPLHAQELTGKWKGYFIPNNDPESRIYIYEVDIIENENPTMDCNLQLKYCCFAYSICIL